VLGGAPANAQQTYDLLIRNGRLLDGTGNSWFYGDLAITGDRIAAIGDLSRAEARRVIDAGGLYLAPGFIDTHSHAGPGLATKELSGGRPLLAQGITTVFINPDGGGPVDLVRQRRDLLEHGLGVNVALMVPHGSVRGAVLGMEDRAATPAELEEMKALVRAGMEAGAFGLSSGPFYPPGSYASTAELVELARVAAAHGGVYSSHIRDESDYTIGVVAAVEEVITVAREGGLPGVVTHIKALGPRVWGYADTLVQRIERARGEGVEVYADQYPYEASSTSLSAALLPRWAQAGGSEALAARLDDPATLPGLRAEMVENLERRGGAERIQFASYRPDRSIEGKTLQEVAAARALHPIDLALELVRGGGPGIVSFNMQDDDIVTLMRQPWTMTASDGTLVRLGSGVPHPRAYGTFPRKIRKYVLEEGVLDLPTAIRGMTSLPARVYGLDDRGILQVGKVADIVVFDLQELTDNATYQAPHQLSSGMVHVIVGGHIAVEGGAFADGGLHGQVLSRQSRGGRAAISASAEGLADQVEIRRTTHGIPHIKAENLRAAGFALGYVQLEDYGDRVPLGLIRARGEAARHLGAAWIDSDLRAGLNFERALETYHLLEQDTRDIYEGFAAGVNRYIELHPEEFPEWLKPSFTGHDILAAGISRPGEAAVRRILRRLEAEREQERVALEARRAPAALESKLPHALALEPPHALEPEPGPEDGSNAWALAPSRTRSGKAILLRNPHLSWSAGYYEAHVTVPGKLNFYGDFRIGGPLGIVGGFNENLGWATTNNSPDLDEVYALEVDPARPDHYLFDGSSIPLQRKELTVEFKNGEGLGLERREVLSTPLGPVVHRAGGKVYVLRYAGEGEYRTDEQFLRMMKARNLAEWKAAVEMRARTSSNLTYADRDGNIFYVWNATIPALPHPSGGDSVAIPALTSSQVWTRPVAFGALPQLLNPKGGYIRNENDPPYFTNLNQFLDPATFPANFPENRLRLRSQHSLELIHNRRKLSLDDVVRLKHSMRMTLADRVKDDLVAAVRASGPAPEVSAAIDLIARWDNTVAAESRGALLFEAWWWEYVRRAPSAPSSAASAGFAAPAEALFRQPWTPARPIETPHGLADPERVVAAFEWAVEETRRRFGAWDLPWGEVHRVRRGEVDVPVGGCSGLLGCFRVLTFQEDDDGKRIVNGGDGWILAVEFTDPIRAYSVLAYGQSSNPDSPYHSDQAELFARNEMRRVAFTEAEIEAQMVRRYRPGPPIRSY
jgi:acyl-homoserine-lactone acylase